MESLKIRLEALEKQIEENVATHDALLKQQEKSIKALQFKQEKFDAGKAARSVFIPTFKVDEGQRNGITKQNILEFFMQNFHDLNISVQEIRILSRKVGACSALVTLGDLVQCYKVLQRVGPRKRIANVILFPARSLKQIDSDNKRQVEAEKKQLLALTEKYGIEKSGAPVKFFFH